MITLCLSTERTRHMDLRFFGLQDWREEGDISLIHIKGTMNQADDKTKSTLLSLSPIHGTFWLKHSWQVLQRNGRILSLCKKI